MAHSSTAPKNEDLSLYGLFALFIENWLTLVISGFSFAIIALVWSLNQPNIYKAETLLMPVTDDSAGLGGLAGSLGGLAAMAGVNIPEGGNDNTQLALSLITSQAFLSEFIVENDLIVPVMAAEDWDLESNKLIINPDIYDQATKQWVRAAKAPRKQQPSVQETYEQLLQLIEVEQDPKTKFVKLSVEFYSPHLAAEWTAKLVNKLNEAIRVMDKDEATESIQYLEQLSEEVYLQELKKAFSALMEEQLKSKMLAEVRKDYVFKVVDPAIAPELKDKPKRAIIIIVAGFLGGIVGLMIILFRTGRAAHLRQSQTA